MREYSREEWAWIKTVLIPSCTATFEYIGVGERYSITIKDDGYAKFPANKNQFWNIQGYITLNYFSWKVVDFKWPNGSDIIPFVNYDGTPYNPVLAKIKSLETRFKNKTLKHRAIQKLALP